MHTHHFKFSPQMIFSINILRILLVLAMAVPLALAGGVSTVKADPVWPATALANLDSAILSTPTGLTCSTLQSKPTTSNTGDKPQSKVWNYGGSWFSVFPTSVSGASQAGTWIWRLEGTAWTEVLRISDRTDTQADVKIMGDLAHILLYSTSPQLITVEYGSGAYHLWATYPNLISLTLSGSRTATIDIDSTGRMWLTAHDSLGNVYVRYSDSPFNVWSDNITIASGIQAMDIEAVTALPNNTIGVMWSNQNTKRFGFKFHNDTDDPTVWSTDEAPGATTAHDTVGLGMADDHINFAVASDSTIYAAIKTGYDTAGYPKIGLLVRRPTGLWDEDIYTIDEQGSRPVVLLNEAEGILTVFYTSSEGYYSILYNQSSTDTINFGTGSILATNSFNNSSVMKANYTNDLVVIYSSSSEVDGQYCLPTPASGADLSITKTDYSATTRPGFVMTDTITAINHGPDAVTGATVVDTLPAALVDASWTCTGSGGGTCTASGTGSINDTVDLPVGGSVVYTLTSTVAADASGTIANTASIEPPGGVTDPLLSNNSITDTDRVVIPGNACAENPALVGCWQMEENGGINLVDGSSYFNDGELFGDPAWSAGKVGSYALDLNGASQFALVPDDATLDLTNQLTLSVWIKPDSNYNQVVVKKALGSVSDGYELSLASLQAEPLNRKVFFRINRASSGDTLRLNSTSYYPMDGLTWMHIAATFDGTTMQLYVNGVLEGSLAVPPGTLIGSNNVPLSIGAEYNATRHFVGALDEVHIYNTALNEFDIQSLYGNHLPVAVADSYSTAEDTLLTVPAAGVLTNDTDGDLSDPKTAVLVGNAAHGTLALNGDGSFSYLPDTNWNGTDIFSYKVFDGKDYGNTATVSITVTAVDDPVVLNPIGNKTVDELTALNFTATAVNVDPTDTITFSLVGAPVGAEIDSVTGAFSWTPTEAQGPGDYPFSVCATDGITPACESITVTVNEINTAPILAAIGNQFAVQDALLTFAADATDSDLPANTLTYSLVGAPTGAAIDPTTGVFTWTPTSGQLGDHTFTVKVCDNGAGPLCDEESITVNVAEAFDLTVLDLRQSINQTDWTDIFGSLGSGYKMGLDPANEFEFLDVKSLSANRPLAVGLYPFTLNTTSLPATYYDYWAVKGVTAAAEAGTWQAWMWQIVNGNQPMFYLKVSAGPAYKLIDGLQWDFASTETYLRISGDYPLWTYIFDGAVESSIGDIAPITAQMTFEALPEITDLTLEESVDKSSWTPLTGDLAGGYEMSLDLLQAFQYIDVASLTANKTLKGGLHPFTLNTTGLPAGYYPFWAAKGVTDLATPGTWQAWMWQIINGNQPMFYLKVSAGPTYKLVDGLSLDYFSTEEYLRVNGDYPLGTYNFDGLITDTIYESAPLTASITFVRLNHAPVANSQSVTTAEDTAVGITLTASDVESDALTWTILSGPSHGVLSGTAPTLTYTPNADFAGDDSFTFKVNDGLLDSNTATVSITVTPVNDPPVLSGIGPKSVDELVLLSFAALATDVDLPADTLTFSLANGLSGSVPAGANITSGGAFTWTPAEADGPGSFTFDVCVSDGTLSDCETITVTVNEVNVAPVLTAISPKSVAETVLLEFDAVASDADIPAQTLTFSLSGTVPDGAGITSAGHFTWTPTEAQGPAGYTFDVCVSDGTLNDCKPVTITVTEGNTAPVLDPIGSKSIAELALLSFDATATDADLPAQTLTFSLAAGEFGIVPAGAAITSIGHFTWTPTEPQGPGSYTFDVCVSDGGLSDCETVHVTVSEVNQAPVLGVIGPQSVDELALLSYNAAATDADLPAQALSYSLANGASGQVPDGASITLGGTFTWTPTEAQGPGAYTFDVCVADIYLGTDCETVTVTVNEVNLAPILGAIGDKNVDELVLLAFDAAATDGDLPANSLTYTLVNGASGLVPAGAEITSGGHFTWTPTEAQGPGVYTFDVCVSDGGLSDCETIHVTVAEVNLAPALGAIGPQSVNELVQLAFDATATDADLPAQTLTYSLANGTSGLVPAGAAITAAGHFTWTPTETDGPGSFTFDVCVTDSLAAFDCETITVTVAEVNVSPALSAIEPKTVNEGSPLEFTATATDADIPANTLTFSLVTALVGPSIDPATGAFTWTPTELQGPGSYNIIVKVCDNGTPTACDQKTVNVTVSEVNQPPVLTMIDGKSIAELTLLTFTATATDADLPANTLTFSLVNGDTGLVPAGASITAGGVFTWTPSEAQGPGLYIFDVCVSDGSASDCETINVTVTEVGAAPVAVADSYTVGMNDVLTVTAPGVLGNDSDADIPADTLTALLVADVSHGSLTLNADGSFTYTPDADWFGQDTFTYKVNDGVHDSNIVTVTITVTEPFHVHIFLPVITR